MARKQHISIENNILHFVYNDSDYLIDLDQLEMVYLYKGCACFYEDKRKMINGEKVNLEELLTLILKQSNFLKCGFYHIINLELVNALRIEQYKDLQNVNKYNVVVTFKTGREESITMDSWLKAEKFYHKIDEQLCKVKYVQTLCN